VKWLIVIDSPAAVERVADQLRRIGLSIEDRTLIPLEDGRQVITVEGPDDLPERLRAAGIQDLSVYPSSEFGFEVC